MAEAKGDRLKADKIVLSKLHELNFINQAELPVLNPICELGHKVTGGKHDAAKAYHEVKKQGLEQIPECRSRLAART